jgi:two-component system sensor histidine kinase/response regulator
MVNKNPVRILLADDQEEIRLLTTQQLERSGHHVVAVANGQQALDAFQREPFDVVFLDEEMPVMTGLQALRAIRELQKGNARVNVVALTGYNTEPDRERLLHAGFDSVIGKPFRLDALEALLKEPRGIAQVGARSDAHSAPSRTPVADLLERVGGDEKLARKVISAFLRDTPKRLAGLQMAVTQKNGASLASIAHALRGSVAIFGAQKACDFSQQLQELGRANDFGTLDRVYEQLKEEIAELEANLRGYAGRKSSPSTGASPKRSRVRSNPKRKTP